MFKATLNPQQNLHIGERR